MFEILVRELVERDGVIGARLANLIKVLDNHIVKDGIIVSQLFAGDLEINVLLLIQLHDRLSEILDTGVLDAFGDKLGSRDEVLGHRIESSEGGILSAAQFVQSLLLNGNTKVVSVFDARNVELDPNFDGATVFDKLERVCLDD